jgi:hypothetical protein
MNLTKTFSTITMILLVSCLATVARGQAASSDQGKQFHDDLLDRFVGKWEVTAVVHGANLTLQREAEWVLNHQYLRLQEKTREVVPWLKIPFERTVYIGYNPRLKHYVVYELTVHGAGLPNAPEGFAYATRTGNELSIDYMNGSEVVGRGRWSWDAATNTWHIHGSRVVDGKEEPTMHQVAVAVARKPG